HNEVQYWQADPWRPLSQRVHVPDELINTDERPWMLSNAPYFLTATGRRASLNAFDPHHPDRLRATLALPKNNSFSAWVQSNDGKSLALGDGGGRVFLVDLASRKFRQLPMPEGGNVTWLAFSRDDAWLGAARQDGAAFAFDVARGTLLHSGQMRHDVA